MIQSKRDESQANEVLQWKKQGCIGTLIAPTGYGKTLMTLDYVITPLLLKYPDYKILIVVNSIGLRNQWKTKIIHSNVTVCTNMFLIVSNEVKGIGLDTYLSQFKLLVIDEIHTCFGDKLQSIIKAKVDWKLGLSATLTSDQKDLLKEWKMPLISEVLPELSIAEKWTSNYHEINIPVKLSRAASEQLIAIDNEYNRLLASINCYHYGDLVNLTYSEEVPVIKDGKQQVYESGNKKGQLAFKKSYPNLIALSNRLGITTSQIMGISSKAKALVLTKKPLFYNAIEKIKTTKYILDKAKQAKRKSITFWITNSFCDLVAKTLNGVSYHGKTKKRNDILDKFNKGEITELHCCIAGNEGLDIKNLSVAINGSYFSTSNSNTQRKGRAVRLTDKEYSIIVNLYCVYSPQVSTSITQEERWLRSFQKQRSKKLSPVIWLKYLEDIDQYFKQDI